MPIRHAAPVDYCALSATSRFLTTTCGDRFVYFWDVPGGALVARYGTRRLFDHLIAATSGVRHTRDMDEYLDVYMGGETVYEVARIQMSADGVYA
ncbi:hypothetical protein BZM27_54160 [Paraburkholderia steynii]|uniref:Uncharacterized protein n=1 Tax=Paraburkholderia steynii TaxID=1245441 RepID=A0A4R0X4N1_9BURK|nr:hypothetical protein BZM27_54160 [Paraburkholderia steynii]